MKPGPVRDLTYQLSESVRYGEFRHWFCMPLLKVEELTDKFIQRGHIREPRWQRQPIFLTQQPTCGRMHSWQGGGLISTMMTMKQRWQGRRVDYDEDGNKDPNGDGQRRPQLLT